MARYALTKLLVLALGLSLTGISSALELSGSLSADYEYSDNADKDSVETVDDISQTVNAELGILEQGKKVTADANINLEHEYYFDDTYTDKLSFTSGFGLFSVDLIESFLNWQLSFTRTQVLVDSSDDIDGEDKEFKNVLRTGPAIEYAVSRAATVRLSAEYVAVENSSEEAADTERLSGNLGGTYNFNTLTSVFFNSGYEEMIDGDGDDEYYKTNASVGLARQFSLGQASFTYGKTFLNIDGNEREQGNFIDVIVSREQIYAHEFTLKYHQELSDTVIGFEIDESGNADELAPLGSITLNDVVEIKRFSLTAERAFDSFVYDLTATSEVESFKSQDYEEEFNGLRVGLEPIISARFQPRFQYGYGRQDFDNRDGLGVDTTRTYVLSGGYRSNADITLNASIAFEKRTNAVDSSREYEEIAVGLGINWEFL